MVVSDGIPLFLGKRAVIPVMTIVTTPCAENRPFIVSSIGKSRLHDGQARVLGSIKDRRLEQRKKRWGREVKGGEKATRGEEERRGKEGEGRVLLRLWQRRVSNDVS